MMPCVPNWLLTAGRWQGVLQLNTTLADAQNHVLMPSHPSTRPPADIHSL